ncbi:hypothetical protein BDV39DRAFT_175013 [Aspergillus sergii]|uniref:Secreted protein n=1 Tax=Aspergillus sergii TaxID=1034303 RepID=A0A5N6X3X7_9EURO|nr:hypothetical protein BDV39DRAFT_175013 [Aspergillus sergii]
MEFSFCRFSLLCFLSNIQSSISLRFWVTFVPLQTFESHFRIPLFDRVGIWDVTHRGVVGSALTDNLRWSIICTPNFLVHPRKFIFPVYANRSGTVTQIGEYGSGRIKRMSVVCTRH